MAAGGELAHHDFAVYKVFRAAEADKSDFQRRCSKRGYCSEDSKVRCGVGESSPVFLFERVR
jgi:hypothetical protein